uniref:DUF4160 domain-containing protein n=1 Tax=Candidatus Kentrum sp. DK TaxID=2126562 RepID=A0A450RX32_9GAMM|nr:MAG: protein of unknown function (DUF4160) [Candidatus Kentron sp. DK]
MPAISMFYGIIIRMMFLDTQQHHLPHLHLEYQGMSAVVSLPDGELIEGNIPAKKLRLVQAWITIHEDELMADWALAVKGEQVFPIEPLR